MTNDQETEILRAIKWLSGEVTVVAKNTSFIGLTLLFIAFAVVAHVWHHW